MILSGEEKVALGVQLIRLNDLSLGRRFGNLPYSIEGNSSFSGDSLGSTPSEPLGPLQERALGPRHRPQLDRIAKSFREIDNRLALVSTLIGK